MFYVMIVCDITATFMALLWLKPVATQAIAKAEGAALSAALVQASMAKERQDAEHLAKVG